MLKSKGLLNVLNLLMLKEKEPARKILIFVLLGEHINRTNFFSVGVLRNLRFEP
jgi:hypothetical protein